MNFLPSQLAQLGLVLLLVRAEAVAPADEDEVCNTLTPESKSFRKVLLDSWRYQTLLSASVNAVWTTDSESGTSQDSVWAATGLCGNSSVSVCSGRSSRVLETQSINKSLPALDTYPVRVFVNITYFINCSTTESACGTNFLLQVKDDSNNTLLEDNLDQSNRSRVQQFHFDLIPNKTENFRLLLVSPPNSSGCIRVSRVLVYRNECPGHERRPLPQPLVRRPSVQAPVNGSVSVTSSYCAENSHRGKNSNPQDLTCTAEGTWFNDGVDCKCDEGFYMDGTVCRAITIRAMSEFYTVSEDQGSVQVCFYSNVTTKGDLRILTENNEAISNFDYVAVDKTVSFGQPDGLSQCVNISIISDGLTENNESFSVDILNGTRSLLKATVIIKNNSGSTTCSAWGVGLVRGADNSSLQLVETCGSDGVWYPLCDQTWSQCDITVICRELGYSSVANNATTGKANNKSVIHCSGTETHLIDCPSNTSSLKACSYLLVECNGTTDQPTDVGPTKVVTPTVSSVSAMSLAGAHSTPAVVVSSPKIEAPQSTSEENGPSVAVLATAISVVVVLTAVASILSLSLIIYIRWKRSILKQHTNDEKQSKGHLSNPVYEAPTIMKMKSEGGETHKQETEESATLYNPLYSLPNGADSKHNNDIGVEHSRFPYETPEYSTPSAVVYETPTVSSPSTSPDPPPTTPPPHNYDYAAAVPPHTDPEYAPLEETRSCQSLDGIEAAPANYHTLEPPKNPVIYHVLEPPGDSDNGTPDMSQENTVQCNEYATLEHK